ncbi:hypothetical protein Tco_0945252 [Tanacetum coccineum]
MSARIAKAAAFGTSELVEDSEDKSLDSDTEREGLEDEGYGSDDEGPGSKEEGEAVPEDPEDGRVYTDIPTYVPLVAPVQTPPSPEWSSATIAVDEDEFLEVGAQLKLYGSILHDHTQRLDALPPTLFKGYDRDLRELYTRSVLALKAWVGQTDTQRAALWHAICDTQRENHDLKMQIVEERHDRLELTDGVARMKRRQESRGE